MCFTYPTGPSNLCDLPIETKRRLYAAQKAVDKAVTFELELVGQSLSFTMEECGINWC
jgi:hypothetical protein